MTGKELAQDAAAYALALGIPVLAASLGGGVFLLDVLVLVPFVWLGIRRGKGHTAVLAVLAAVAVYLIAHFPVLALSKGLMIWGVSSVFVTGIKRQWRTGKILFWGSLIGSCYGLADLFSFGPQPISTLEKLLTENFLAPVMQNYRQAGVLQLLQQQGMTEGQVKETLVQAFQLFARLFPSLLILNGILIVLCGFLITRFVIRRGLKMQISSRPFKEWSLPWYAIWGAIFGLAAYLGGDYLGQSWLAITGMNIGVVYFLICLVLGTALAVYFLSSPRFPRLLKVVFAIITLFNLPLTVIILVVFGLFDLVMNFRRIPESM